MGVTPLSGGSKIFFFGGAQLKFFTTAGCAKRIRDNGTYVTKIEKEFRERFELPDRIRAGLSLRWAPMHPGRKQGQWPLYLDGVWGEAQRQIFFKPKRAFWWICKVFICRVRTNFCSNFRSYFKIFKKISRVIWIIVVVALHDKITLFLNLKLFNWLHNQSST